MKFKTIILAWVALIPICAWSWGSADTGFRSGTVLEVIDTSNYTYLKIEEADATSWLATPTMAVQAGDLVRFSGGMEMGAFHSTELDREFDGILFIGDIEILKPGDFTHHADGVTGPAAEDAPDIPAPLAGEIRNWSSSRASSGTMSAWVTAMNTKSCWKTPVSNRLTAPVKRLFLKRYNDGAVTAHAAIKQDVKTHEKRIGLF
jgi:hypothetical protein